MSSTGSCVEVFAGLGLTELEAQVYVFLLQHSPATGYKISESGENLAMAIRCVSCRETIPPVPCPTNEPPKEEFRKWEYKCPVCGKAAYPAGLGPKPGRDGG